MSLGLIGLGCVWILSLAPLVLPYVVGSPPERFSGVSVLALAALPWLAWFAAPRRRPTSGSISEDVAALTLALPPLALAAGVDRAQGAADLRLALVGALVLASALVLSAVARRASGSSRASAIHALFFAVFIAFPVPLAWALGHGGEPFVHGPPALVAFLAQASPLGWLVDAARDVRAPLALPWATIALVALCALASTLMRAEDRA